MDEPVFVDLPDGYKIRFSDLPEHGPFEPAKMSRTMGCVGGAVKFVCVRRRSLVPNRVSATSPWRCGRWTWNAAFGAKTSGRLTRGESSGGTCGSWRMTSWG